MSMSGHFLRDIPLRALQRKVGDEHVTLLQACYDNPLFTEDDDKAERGKATGGRSGSARGSGGQDGRVPVAKDYMHSLPPGPPAQEVRFKSKAKRRNLLKFSLCVLVAVVVLAIIIGLIVHFLREYFF
nr:hypothetical protein BaRGS_023160 [Batillaria attramentaria]